MFAEIKVWPKDGGPSVRSPVRHGTMPRGGCTTRRYTESVSGYLSDKSARAANAAFEKELLNTTQIGRHPASVDAHYIGDVRSNDAAVTPSVFQACVIGTVIAQHLSNPLYVFKRVGVRKYKAIVPSCTTNFRKGGIQDAVVVCLQVIEVVPDQGLGRGNVGIDIGVACILKGCSQGPNLKETLVRTLSWLSGWRCSFAWPGRNVRRRPLPSSWPARRACRH